MSAALPSLPAPFWTRVVLTLLLPVIALVIYFEGQHYDRGLMELKPAESAGEIEMPERLESLERLGPVQRFDAENLYEYINGHAEYYLDAGFKGLSVGEYASPKASQPELVVNLYDMGEPLHAFGVLMDELGPAATPIEVGSMGFAMDRAVNLIHGPYYAQINAFSEGLDLTPLSRAFAEQLAASSGEVERLDLSFPDLGTPLETYFVKEDYRGLGMLDNALERIFRRGEEEITAFLITGEAEWIRHRVAELKGFLEEDGIPFEPKQFEGGEYTRVEDPYEGQWFFIAREERLLGVYAAPTPALLQSILR